MTRAWAIVASAILVLGCQSGEEPPRGAHRGVEPPVTYQARPTPTRGAVEPPEPPEPAPELIPSGTSDPEQERDLGAELQAALGMPVDCIRDFRSTSPTTIRISVSGIVRPTGMIIQPSAYGNGLSAAALDCIKRRIGTVVLEPLDDTISQTAATVVEIEYAPEVIVEADPGVPEPVLRNVREPLPKRPEVAPSGKPIQEPTSKWISGGFEGGRPIQEPKSKKISGPKPRPIDGYEVDENAQDWR